MLTVLLFNIRQWVPLMLIQAPIQLRPPLALALPQFSQKPNKNRTLNISQLNLADQLTNPRRRKIYAVKNSAPTTLKAKPTVQA